MPLFWTRNNVRTSEDKAIAFAYSFMGVRCNVRSATNILRCLVEGRLENFQSFFTRIAYARGNAPRKETQADYEEILKQLGVDPKLKEMTWIARSEKN